MTDTDCLTLATQVLTSLPEEVLDALAGIDFIAVRDHNDDALPGGSQPDDFLGLFVGSAAHDPDPSDELGVTTPPVGAIYLNASRLHSEEDVQATLMHEIGHALGMSEDEVDEMLRGDEDAAEEPA